MFKIRPFQELVAMTKEKLDEAMIPLRVRAAKAKAEGEVIKLEEQQLALEAQINEACAKKELDFNQIADLLDKHQLLVRRRTQITELVAQLFPTEVAVPAKAD